MLQESWQEMAVTQIKVGAVELVRSGQFLGEETFGCYLLARIGGGSVLIHLHYQWSEPLKHALPGWVGFECRCEQGKAGSHRL